MMIIMGSAIINVFAIQSLNIVMLPPGLENRSPHKYGEFNIIIHAITLHNVTVESVSLGLLGMKKAQIKYVSSNTVETFFFTIGTNLWHFYAYLNDARSINIQFKDIRQNTYNCEVQLNLIPSKQILNKNAASLDLLFSKNSYLLTHKGKYDVFDTRFTKIGNVQLQAKLNFQESINRTLFQADLIDFEDILVIDQISPISSTIDLNNMPAQPTELTPIPISSITKQNLAWNVPQSLRHLQEELKELRATEHVADQMNISHMDDEKMMEDDIDRLIAQMQNRPYDSSKYMEEESNRFKEEAKEEPKKQNFNFTNYSLGTAKSQSSEKKERTISSEKYPPRVPPSIKTNMSRPQINLSPHSHFASTVSNPIISYSPQPSSMIKTQTINQNQASSIVRQNDKRQGLIKLKVHELTMSKMERQLSLLLKIYLNEDAQQFYSINGFRQGETISFNSNIKINQKRQISIIRFVLIDTFDMKTIFAQGLFEMTRLFTLNPTTGIFMVNLISPMPEQTHPKVIKIEQKSVVRVTPNLKNLRIQLQYEQTIEIVQIYLCLSEFSSTCKKVCYKIPMTKENIEFKVAQLRNDKHINVFPHNRSSSSRTNERIIIQLWGQTQLIGFTQVSLKPISNTNQAIVNSSLQPILLYDQNKTVNDLKGGKNKASFTLNLYYGNISQIQNLLNRQNAKQRRNEKPNKKMVEVQNHLGIYIKQNKTKKEVEIQVEQSDMQSPEPSWKGSQKNLMVLQQEELPEDQDEDYKHDELETPEQIPNSTLSKNQFMSQSMEEKYLASKQTVPSSKINLKPSPTIIKSLELSQTIKPKPCKSLTREFLQKIKTALLDLATQQSFSSLKAQCQPHLLYNFIQSKDLRSIMRKVGMKQQQVNFLLSDVIIVSNDMVNVIIMYDMIFELMLEGQIKEKYIEDAQIGRYCFMTLYSRIQDEDECDFVFDGSTEFDQSRKIFQKMEYKLTMRQFNLIHTFLTKRREDLGHSYEQIKHQLSHNN